LTSVLIYMNKTLGVQHTGIRIVGGIVGEKEE